MLDFGESDKMIKISGKGIKQTTGLVVIFHSLFIEFLQTFNMKILGYFSLLRECFMYLNSSSRCCGLHILSTLR